MVDLKKLRLRNIEITKKYLKENTTRDILIIQVIHTIDETITIINKLSTNLRERYSYYAPRLCKDEDLDIIIDGVIKKVKEEDIAITLNDLDLDSIVSIARELKILIKFKESQEYYLECLTKDICPRTAVAATPIIAARLIDRAGSLKHLAELPSSTIQVLGAEKALFRHLRTGSKSPKFGVIFAHPKVSEAVAKEKGRAARHLASEISKACKIDYFSKKANN